MLKTCPQLRSQLKSIKALHSDYSLELEQAKTSKEYEVALSIQPKLTQAILELGFIVNPDKYIEVYVSEIERKHKANIPFTNAEIIFLYDVRDKVFDPRILEILKTRNPKEDVPIVLDCQPNEIAWDVKEVNENTKTYIGPWNIDIFRVIKNYPNITHLYEFFPDKKILMQSLETDPSIDSPEKAEQALLNKNIEISQNGNEILKKTKFSQTPEIYNLVRFTVGQLGLKDGATTDEIYKRAKEHMLGLCPGEVGPHLSLKYRGRAERFFIAMKEAYNRWGYQAAFYLKSDRTWLSLDVRSAGPDEEWLAGNEFVFCFRKEDKKV
jgi:hypothetical protein